MPINRSFSGRNRDVHNHGGRLPPGQSLTEGFPVLTAGPTPKALALGDWRLTLKVGVRPVRVWTWSEFQALPQTEQVVATVGGRIQPVRDWQFELLATYGDYTNNLNIVRFFDDGRLRETNGAQDFSSLEVTGKLDGTLLSLVSGDVGFALGGGYLEQELGFGPMRADRATSYAFGELAVPLINEDMAVPLVQRLELNLSGRYTDTSDFGDSFDPKVGLLWAINDELKLRGTYGQAFRAPTLPDLIPSETSYVILPVEGPLGTFPDPFSNDNAQWLL